MDGKDPKSKNPDGISSFFTTNNRSSWSSLDFWKRLCPELTISSYEKEDVPYSQSNKRARNDASAEAERRRKRLIEDGYVLVDSWGLEKKAGSVNTIGNSSMTSIMKRLTSSIMLLQKNNSFPATFILLFDETWSLARSASKELASCTHQSNVFNFDLLAWCIDHKKNAVGFSPHRDRQPENISNSFHSDGQAKYVTMWTALTDANPENSCLYVIPRQYDPGYDAGDDNDDDDSSLPTDILKDKGKEQQVKEDQKSNPQRPDPLSRALPTKESYQNIRAAPRLAGQSILFTHRIMHWGSRGNPNSHVDCPRVAISFVASDPKFEQPYLSDKEYWALKKIPPFPLRLLLVCAQLLIYYQRFNFPKECIRACYEYCKEYSDYLDETYRKKVYVEFVKAMREDATHSGKDSIASNTNCSSDGGEGIRNEGLSNSVDDDDEEDAVLEEMLNAETGGYGEFEDDFDEIDEAYNDEAIDDDNDDDDDKEEGILFRKIEKNENQSEIIMESEIIMQSSDCKKKQKTS